MKNKINVINKFIFDNKVSLIRLFIILCCIIGNVFLSRIADCLGYPLYLDTIGTMVSSYVCGLIGGVVTALISNAIYTSMDGVSIYFAIVNIAIAMLTSFFFHNGKKVTVRKVALFIILNVIISTILGSSIELALSIDASEIMEGDVINYLSSIVGLNRPLSYILAGLIYNLPDKMLSVLATGAIIWVIPSKIRQDIEKSDLGELDNDNSEFDEKKRNMLKRRLLWVLSFLAITLTVVIARVSINLYVGNFKAERISTVKGVTQLISGAVDADKIDYYLERGFGDPEYDSINGLMVAIQENTPGIEYVYIYKVFEKEIEIVFDTDPNFQKVQSVGERLAVDDVFKPYIPALMKGEKIEPIEVTDKYGWFITYYSPIYDSNGNCTAYVGADMAMSDIRDSITGFALRVGLISAGFLLVSLTFGLWMTSKYHSIIDGQYLQIKNAKDEADRANLAKSRFVANMSHEIRTPINTIMGMNEMVLREDTKDVPEKYETLVRKYSLSIKKSSELLLGIINDILDVTKVESGKTNIVNTEYNTLDQLHSLTSMIRVKSNEKGLDFTTDIDENIPSMLFGDEGKIKQIVLNLLTNAVKYTQEGGFTLKVQLVEKSDDKCKLFFSVKDTGMGVKAEDIEKLFTAFERLEEETNSGIQGTGLGLHISSQFVKLMGGELKCESTYGQGSDFYFTIEQGIIDATPIGKYVEDEKQAPLEKYVPEYVAPSVKVLVVDDNDMNLQVIEGLLSATKMQVTLVQSGRECLEKMETEDFHVVLLDHMMPEMDGVETLKEIRKEFEDLPVIALTANAAHNGEEFYKGLGFNGYLPKPVNGKQLEETIKNYVPKDLLKEPSESDEYGDGLSPENAWLREAKGINIEDGLLYCGGEKAFIKFIRSFYDSIDSKAKEIKDAFDVKDYELYTIKVHALKSTARIIGASKLSNDALMLEEAGKKGDIDYILNNNEEFLEFFMKYKQKLAVVDENREVVKKKDITEDELKGAYDVIKEAATSMDYDSAEFVLEQLHGYKLQKEDQERFDKLEKMLKNFKWEQMEELISNM